MTTPKRTAAEHLREQGLTEDEVHLVHRLSRAGVPIIAVGPDDKPRQPWKKVHSPADCQLSLFREGDALLALGGHGIDVVDLDTKVKGNSLGNLPIFDFFGVVRTPSGGRHYYVRSTGVAGGDLRGVGDYCGGLPDGTSRLGWFLPGSRRSKYPDGGYVVEQPVDVRACLRAKPDGDLAEAVREARPAKDHAQIEWNGEEATDAQKEEAEATLQRMAKAVAKRQPGEGREPLLYGCLSLLSRYVAGGSLTQERMDEVMFAAVDAQPATGASHDDTYERVSANAAKWAAQVGPLHPETDDDDVFDRLPDLSHGDVDDRAVTGHVTRLLAHYGKGSAIKLPSGAPVQIADFLLEKFWTLPGGQCLILRTWMGAAYEWHTTHWEEFPAGHLKAVVCRLLENALVKGEDGWKRLNPNQETLGSVTAFIEQKTIIHARLGAGHWIDCTDGKCPVGEYGRRYVSFKNCILDLDTNEEFEHSSAFFNTYSLGFHFDPTAVCPRWEQALEEWFPGDKDSQDALEEQIAWFVLGGITLDKIIVWLGEWRAGKGTVSRLIQAMLGVGYATQRMDELNDRFAMEDLIGLLVCHISEATSGRDNEKIVSLMKGISGRDYKGTKIKRKGQKSESNVTLEVKFLITGNVVLTLTDASGVIITRLVVLWFGQSFLGREDPSLEPDLHRELSGIFNRVRAAHARLLERGRLTQPASGAATIDGLRRKAAPDKTWFEETYEITGDLADQVLQCDVVESYRDLVDSSKGHLAVTKVVADLIRGKDVTTGRVRLPDSKEQVRVYKGLRALAQPEEE